MESVALALGSFGTLVTIVVVFVNAISKLTKAITSLEVTMKHVVQHSENQERVAEHHADRLRLQDISIAHLTEQINALTDKVKTLWDEYNKE